MSNDNESVSLILYVDRSTIRPGQAVALESAAQALAQTVRAGPSRAFWYAIHFSEDRSTMTVTHLHPDSDSLEDLMDLIAPKLAPFRDLLELQAIDVYGEPAAAVVDKLMQKTRLLGGTIRVHRRVADVTAMAAEAE
jgi:hypothetical protein